MSSIGKDSNKKETLEMSMNFVNDEVTMEFTFENSTLYKSIDELELIEARPFETRFPGCRLRWRGRYFRDAFHKPPRHSASLQLLSCQVESSDLCPELTEITAESYMDALCMNGKLVNLTFHLHGKLMSIYRNIRLDSDQNEKDILEYISDGWAVKFEVCVKATFRPKDLTFSYKRGDFTTLPPISLVREEDEKVTLQESFSIFNEVTATTYEFEKFAVYESSEALSCLQSRHFETPFPHCRLTWRVRYLRDTFQKSPKHSVSLQLLDCSPIEKQQIQVRVTCRLRIGHSEQVVLAVELLQLQEDQTVPITKSESIDSDTIEKLLAEAKDELRVGLVVHLQAYERCIKPSNDN